MNEFQDQFIILKKTKFSESDLIIHALSKTGTKKAFIAKAALKSKKRFGGGVLEPTHFVMLTYKQSQKVEQLAVLNEAMLIDDFKAIRTDYDRLEFGLFIINCAYQVAQEGDFESHFLFNLVGHSLRQLGSTQNLIRFKLHFYLKFLFQQGVISVEDWMSPFLKINMSDSDQLNQWTDCEKIVELYTDSIETQVIHYIKNADMGF